MRFVNRPLRTFAIISITIGLIVSSCTSKDVLPDDRTPIITSDPTAQSTPVITNTPILDATATLAATAGIPPIEIFKNIVSDENYLKDCKAIYSVASDQQAGFHEVYPGVSTEKDIMDQLGDSYEKFESNKGKQYLYFDFSTNHAYSFFVINNTVDDIDIISDLEVLTPLQKILEKFGCPDFFIAVALNKDDLDASLNYNKVFMVYLDAGIRIRFDGYPISYSDIPSLMSFVKPGSFNDFLELESDLATGFLISKSSLPISFSEAVK